MFKRKEIDIHNCTLLEACYVFSGRDSKKTRKVYAFAYQWQKTEDVLGRRLTQQEYADFWDISLRTVERDNALFRSVFNRLSTPSDLPRAEEVASDFDSSELA